MNDSPVAECIRQHAEGPCNGYPRLGCPGYANWSRLAEIGDRFVELGAFGSSPLPEPTAEELARGLAGAFDSPSMHVFDSWTDGDLYRAIQYEPQGPGHAAAVAEYVEELRSRQARQEEQAALEARLREQYRI